jgi:hypothetical protein
LPSPDCPPIHCPSKSLQVRLTIRGWALMLSLLLVRSGPGAEVGFAQVPQSENQSNVVRGTVVNARTHEPIGRALVHSPDNRYSTLTDGEGHFEFTLPKVAGESEPGSYSSGYARTPIWLMARKPGYLDDRGESGPEEMVPGKEVTIFLMPEGVIKGRVTFSAAEPAHGLNVEIVSRQVTDGVPRWRPSGSSSTNSKGEFRFSDLQPGTYKLLTHEWMDNDPVSATPDGQLYGFPPMYYPSATDFASASTIQLAAGQSFEADLSLIRQAYYAVRIPVTNTEPDGGMNITVSPQAQRGPGYSLGYNRARQTIEGQLPNGKYLVEATVYGPNAASGSVNIAVAGASLNGPGMVLMRNNSISVNVREEFSSNDGPRTGSWSDGKHTFAMHGPRLDINVRADPVDEFEQRGSASIRQPTGPNDDSLVLENLAPGRYWLRLSASRGYVASATMGGLDLLREPLVVVPGASTPIDITMRDDNAELEGNLLGVPATSPTSTPRAHIYCIPLADSPGQFLDLSASSDGRFDYRMVAPGAYRVVAFGSPQHDLPYRDSEAMKLYETKGQVVQFAPGQKVTLQLPIISASE